MKIYVFNHTIKGHRTDLAVAIISTSRNKANELYEKETANTDYKVDEYEIIDGLQIWAEGYDDESIKVVNAQPNVQ